MREGPGNRWFLYGISQCFNRRMSQPTGTTDSEYGNIPVSTEFRQKLRVAKAEAGDTYEEFLRKHVSLE